MLLGSLGSAGASPADEAKAGLASVINFGAQPNGDAPADEAIARAIASGATIIYFPPGMYRLRRPIDVTQRPSGSITLQGAGTGDRPGIATTLVGETGGAIIDATGSQFVTIEDLTLSSGKANPSTLGILFARSARSNYAQFNRVINVSIFLENSLSSNHAPCAGIGLFNFGAELFRTENLYIRAPIPMVLTNENFCRVQSLYAPLMQSQTSLSVIELASTTLWAFDGPGLVLHNAINLHAGSLYINSQKTNSSKFAIEAQGHNTLISMNVSVENFPSILRYSGLQENLTLNVTTPDASMGSSLVADGTQHACAVLRSAQIRVSSLAMLQPGPHYMLDYQGNNVCGVQESVLFLGESQAINMPLGYFSGTVYSDSPNPFIHVADSPGYTHYILIPRNGPMKISGEMSPDMNSPGRPGSQGPIGAPSGNPCAVRSGSGDPNGAVYGKPCDMYLNKTGGPGKTLYIKETGESTNAGWAAK